MLFCQGRRYTILSFFIFFFLPIQWCIAQSSFTLNYPKNRMVLQRDKNNTATVTISGSFSQVIDRVEVQFRALNGGRTSDWITIKESPTGGYFSGSVSWEAGWYELEARGIYKGQVAGVSSISRFGIGDVFIVAGQSNAQGYLNYGAKSAADDRVNCINFYNANTDHTELPNPEYSHLDANSFIAPRGNSAWGWGRLGDKITSRTGLPVLFYNVGWYGSGSVNWQESIRGSTLSVYDGRSPYEPSGMPFGNLRLVMNYYVPSTGVRAILWQQGEADNFANNSKDSYAYNLRTVINQIRQETNKDLTWVIARSSHDNVRGSNPNIIRAQNEIISSMPNTFAGPETDRLQLPRLDGAHFQNEGLEQLGDAWGSSLNDNFWSLSNPFQALPVPTLSVSCNSDYSLTLSLNGSYNSVQWNTNQRESAIRVGGGNYTAKVQDSNGHVLFLPAFNVPDSRQPQTPIVNPDGSTNLCQGETVALHVIGVSDGFSWNSGQTEERIAVNRDGDFSVSNRNGFGCVSTSNVVPVRVFTTPPPAKPNVLVAGPTTFCENEQLNLRVNSDLRKVWSTGETENTISVKTSGIYKVRVVDNNGCSSPESDEIIVKVNPLPATPVVSVEGPTTFCEGASTRLVSNYSAGNIWNTEAQESFISVVKTGDYSVKVRDSNGCVSFSSNSIEINVLPSPAIPKIALSGPPVFCEGETLTLTASSSESVIWNNGSATASILVDETGSFSARAVSNQGCFSASSVPINAVVKAVPVKPSISKVGTYTLEATGSDQEQILYEWRRGDVALPSSTGKIKTVEGGSYKVSTYEIFEDGKLYCISPMSEQFIFTVEGGSKGLSVYPNPTSNGNVTVETFQNLKEAWIELYDESGHQFQTYFIGEVNEQKFINLGDLPRGIYIFKVRSAQFTATQKIVVQ